MAYTYRPNVLSTLETKDTSATSAKIGGGITAGTGAVALVTTGGKLASLNSTYVATITANTSGTILRSNGTNFINSTITWPDTLTSNGILRANGTTSVTTGSGLTDDGTTFTAHSTTLTASAASFPGTVGAVGPLTVSGTLGRNTFGGVAAAGGSTVEASYSTMGNVAGGFGAVGSNYYPSGANSLYKQTDVSSRILFQSGGFTFQMAPSGSINTTITYTTRGTMHPSGGFSWGDATDPGATNFRVAGTTTVVGSETAAAFIPSSSTIPTNGMYLSAANTLAFATNTTAAMQIKTGVTIGGTTDPGAGVLRAVNYTYGAGITATTLAAGNNNDLDPGNATVLRLTGDAGGTSNLTGMAGGVAGRTIYLFNVGSPNFSFSLLSGGSTANNQFLGTSSFSTPLGAEACVLAVYDGTSNKWRISKIS